ncbi:MAG: ribonuclease HI family protein [Candidatus Peregrinibacteria bacterium]
MASLYCDGASRGNPGLASAGFWAEENGETIFAEGVFLGETTNNVAEWTGLLLGLQEAKKRGIPSIDVFLDSELVVKQMQGIYRVKNEKLLPIFGEVLKVMKAFESVKFTHIPRAKNSKADALANKALDER